MKLVTLFLLLTIWTPGFSQTGQSPQVQLLKAQESCEKSQLRVIGLEKQLTTERAKNDALAARVAQAETSSRLARQHAADLENRLDTKEVSIERLKLERDQLARQVSSGKKRTWIAVIGLGILAVIGVAR